MMWEVRNFCDILNIMWQYPPHSLTVIPSFGSGLGQFGSLGVSWNAALPQQPSTSIDSAPTQPTATIDEGVATPTDSTHHEDDLGKVSQKYSGFSCSKFGNHYVSY